MKIFVLTSALLFASAGLALPAENQSKKGQNIKCRGWANGAQGDGRARNYTCRGVQACKDKVNELKSQYQYIPIIEAHSKGKDDTGPYYCYVHVYPDDE